jgi:hypothetical protein
MYKEGIRHRKMSQKREKIIANKECITHAEKFKLQACNMLKRIAACLDSCFNAKLTDVNNKGLLLGLTQVEKKDALFMIEDFIGIHEHWGKVFSKDTDFVFNTFPELYKSDALDTKILPIPLKIYHGFKDTGYKGLKEEKWPVNSEDELALWQYFKNMVTLSCRYIHEFSDKKKFVHIPLDKYVKDYGIKLIP